MLSDLSKAAMLSPHVWLDLAHASLELARARHQLGSRTASELLALRGNGETGSSFQTLDECQRRLVTRVSFAVPRMGARVPWRSDCLVQALAARHWLERAGIMTVLCIGVRKLADFEAHAWLKVGDVVVTGGDISGFTPLSAANAA